MRPMDFEGPSFIGARAVFDLPVLTTRSPEHDEAFIRAVRNDFPNLVSHQRLPPETPLQVPHIVLQSNASRLGVSAINAELDVRFFGDYVTSFPQCRDYLLRKLTGVLNGWAAMEFVPSLLGMVIVANYSAKNTGENPVEHILRRQLCAQVDPAVVQDAQVRVAVRLFDRYFLNLGLSNYESRTLERPVFPGQQMLMKPWEGQVGDSGLQLTLDLNNRLSGLTTKSDPLVTPAEVKAMIDVWDQAMVSIVPDFIESGLVSTTVMTSQSL
jgi:hypothetical protein